MGRVSSCGGETKSLGHSLRDGSQGERSVSAEWESTEQYPRRRLDPSRSPFAAGGGVFSVCRALSMRQLNSPRTRRRQGRRS